MEEIFQFAPLIIIIIIMSPIAWEIQCLGREVTIKHSQLDFQGMGYSWEPDTLGTYMPSQQIKVVWRQFSYN